MRWDVVTEITDRLAAAGVPSPEVDARRLVEHVEDRFGTGLGGCDAHVLDALVARRAAREPLQQILGRTWFRHLELACAPGVFVPRPETEVVAGVAIEAAQAVTGRSAVVVEPCTGTGAIALAVASEVPHVRVVAADRSPAAVAVAERNRRTLAAAAAPAVWRPGPWLAPRASVAFVVGDLLEPIPASLRRTVDVLVANPPYLPVADTGTWEPEVADHDPRDALVGGPDGHEIVNALLHRSVAWLRPGGTVVVEIDGRRGADAAETAAAAGLVDVHVVPDLTGRDRAVTGRRRHGGSRR